MTKKKLKKKLNNSDLNFFKTLLISFLILILFSQFCQIQLIL